MMKYTSRPEQERAAQQERDQRAERTLREQQAEQARANPAYDDCADCLNTTFDVIWYVVTCCGCCTPFRGDDDDIID